MSSKYYRHLQKEASKEIQDSFLNAKLGPGLPDPKQSSAIDSDPEKSAQRVIEEDKNQVLFAGLVSHGAFGESGPVGAHFFKILYDYALRKFPQQPQRAFDTIVVLGTSHESDSPATALSKRAWYTPYGMLFPDFEIIGKLEERGLIVDEIAHEKEHSIENQLPFISFLFLAIKIVPVMVGYGGSQSIENVESTATIIAETIQSLGRQNRVLILATTDYSHVGPLYNVHPPPGQTIYQYCFEQDRIVLEPIRGLDGEELLKLVVAHQITMCGVWATICFIKLVSLLGLSAPKLLQYGPSYVSVDRADITCYAALVSSRPNLVPGLDQSIEEFDSILKRSTLDYRPPEKPEPPVRPSDFALVAPPPSSSSSSSSSQDSLPVP